LNKTRAMLQSLKERIAQVKVGNVRSVSLLFAQSEWNVQNDTLGEQIDKIKEDTNSAKERMSQSTKLMSENEKRLIALAREMEQKEIYQSKLGVVQQQIQEEAYNLCCVSHFRSKKQSTNFVKILMWRKSTSKLKLQKSRNKKLMPRLLKSAT
jgi:hypothetical protein